MPSTRPHLHEVGAELERQAVVTEAQLRAAIWQGNKAQERAARIQLNELNSKLLLIHARVRVN
ncbi:hypothetical protein [Deinococcus sp. QL22]|uniref:hypothetical protein n=1 Tax=Deinococcus sp. QL22 TaxID=2939437 RepID=UPI0020173584|nr:hypothetical protein [Deinococcus sp. QL22]UQN04881.1 hypothetical protein M1R55_08075 [Deinococcus sp. QL22]